MDIMSAFPYGVILPWYAKSGPMPAGWAVCDGSNGTPDLRGRFLRGVSDMADVGRSGGRNTATLPQDGRKGSDYHWGETPWAGGPDPAIGGAEIAVLPPYVDVLYIMRTA